MSVRFTVFVVFCVLRYFAVADCTRLAADAKQPTAENGVQLDYGTMSSDQQRAPRLSALKSPLYDGRVGANPDPAATTSSSPAAVRSEHAESPCADADRRREMTYAAYDRHPAHATITSNGPAARWKSYGGVRGSRNGGVDYNDYEDEGSHIKIPTGGSYVDDNDGMADWYGGIKRPAVESSTDPKRIDIWTVIKIGLAKLKTFKVIKLLILLAVKLKLLSLFKFFSITKLLVFGNFKLLLLPFLPSLWARLVTASSFWSAMTSHFDRNTTAECMSISTVSTGNLRNTNGLAPELKTPADVDQSFGMTFVPKSVQFVTSVQLAQCLERTACYAASFVTPSFWSVRMSGILPSLVDYIPYRKLKLYMTTFKEVTNTRLENIFIKPSAENWLKWCDEHYQCEDKTRSENDN